MALIWGIPYLFIKIAVTELSPASLVLFRTAIGTVLLLPLAAARKDLAPVLKQWKWILVYTAAEVAAPWLLLSDAEQRISSSLAGLLLAATPSFGAILAWATGGHDRFDRRRIIGLAIGFVGVGALVGLTSGRTIWARSARSCSSQWATRPGRPSSRESCRRFLRLAWSSRRWPSPPWCTRLSASRSCHRAFRRPRSSAPSRCLGWYARRSDLSCSSRSFAKSGRRARR